MLTDAQTTHLEQGLYPRTLAAAGEIDSPRNRTIAASDYWLFLELGGGTDAEAIAALTRGMQSCDARGPTGPTLPASRATPPRSS